MSDFDSRVNELVENIIERQNDYLEECHEYAESGHRHQFCFHGVNMWVDYDCACGLCEDGEINEYSDREEIKEYAEDVIRGEMRVENKKKEQRMTIIELLMNGPHKMSFLQAAKKYDEIIEQ